MYVRMYFTRTPSVILDQKYKGGKSRSGTETHSSADDQKHPASQNMAAGYFAHTDGIRIGNVSQAQ